MKNFLNMASKAYYEGSPIISDATFDILFSTYNSDNVGYNVDKGASHFYPMYSLQKCYDMGKAPFVSGTNISSYVVTPKFDGAAVSLLYVEGELQLALTRGNGKKGQDITEKMKLLVPTRVPDASRILQVTGEVVAPSTIKNSRNFSSGSLGLKDLAEFKNRLSNLCFIAYGMEPSPEETYLDTLKSLSDYGFDTVNTRGYDEVYPTDGEVFRLNSNRAFEAAGFTSSHPRGAFAFKVNKDGVVTTLKDVTWQVGRSGVISPVAILEPVDINGATVSRATLHNYSYIQKLNLEIGCQVEVVRAGEIIPQVVARVS